MNPTLLTALLSTETTPEPWLRRVIEQELSALRQSEPGPGQEPLDDAQLRSQIERRLGATAGRTRALFERLHWMLEPGTAEQLDAMDPVKDCERIFHFVARDFRTELKVFAVLHEMRAAVSLPLASFFLSTGEFSTRGVRRIVDTVLLVCNVLEWGADSVRGRFCIDRINAIHARFHIPNEAFKYVLLGIAFIPFEFNQRFGWRPMTQKERLGWFHAFVRLGRHMNIDELNDDFDEMYAWYRRVSDNAARFAPNKQRLVYDILGQVLACYPANVRGVLVAAFVAGMDDTYLTASGLPRVPEAMEAALRRLFALAGQRARATALQGPWLQSLLTSTVYPEGYELDQLGVSPGASRVVPKEGTMTSEQVEQRVAQGEFLVVFDGGVYDLGPFAEQHPGGRALLERYRGRDASAAFTAGPHSQATRTFRENFRVATLAQTPLAQLPPMESSLKLGVPRTQRLPVPEVSSTTSELASALLPVVNARSKNPLTQADLVAQFDALLAL